MKKIDKIGFGIQPRQHITICILRPGRNCDVLIPQ